MDMHGGSELRFSCLCPPQPVNHQYQGCPPCFHRAHWPSQSYVTVSDCNSNNLFPFRILMCVRQSVGSEITEVSILESKLITLSVQSAPLSSNPTYMMEENIGHVSLVNKILNAGCRQR